MYHPDGNGGESVVPYRRSPAQAAQLHSKIVAIGTDWLCIGSYNWRTADRHGKYVHHETSIAYRGRHLEDEIRIVVETLRLRGKLYD
jgi:hypothetical protein